MAVKQTFEALEHHAYLTIDEPANFTLLFDRGAVNLKFDLRGRTTLNKRGTKDELGIYTLNHIFLEVRRNDIEVYSANELKTLIKTYENHGIINLYLIRLVVEWQNGDMQEWRRSVMHVKDKKMDRESKSGRFNALTMKQGMYEDVVALQEIYGYDIVRLTVCEVVHEEGAEKRVCLSTMPEAAVAEGG